jgi:hypothetical protein
MTLRPYFGTKTKWAWSRNTTAGAWEENNAPLMLALLAIRNSGWWDAFWQWRDRHDREAWQDRQAGKIKVLFRNKRGSKAAEAIA